MDLGRESGLFSQWCRNPKSRSDHSFLPRLLCQPSTLKVHIVELSLVIVCTQQRIDMLERMGAQKPSKSRFGASLSHIESFEQILLVSGGNQMGSNY